MLSLLFSFHSVLINLISFELFIFSMPLSSSSPAFLFFHVFIAVVVIVVNSVFQCSPIEFLIYFSSSIFHLLCSWYRCDCAFNSVLMYSNVNRYVQCTHRVVSLIRRHLCAEHKCVRWFVRMPIRSIDYATSLFASMCKTAKSSLLYTMHTRLPSEWT